MIQTVFYCLNKLSVKARFTPTGCLDIHITFGDICIYIKYMPIALFLITMLSIVLGGNFSITCWFFFARLILSV